MDGALENLEKRVPKVKVGNCESLRQKDSVYIYEKVREDLGKSFILRSSCIRNFKEDFLKGYYFISFHATASRFYDKCLFFRNVVFLLLKYNRNEGSKRFSLSLF